ncbi:hypothetical protein [Streptomyces sp. NPDC050287]
MPLKGEYEPSTAQFVRDQVELFGSYAEYQKDREIPVLVLEPAAQRH